MRPLAWLALLLAVPAHAEDRGDVPAPTLPVVDDPAPDEPVPLAERTAEEPPGDGVWAWVARLEGEVLTPEALDGLREQARVRVAEGALEDELGLPDVPTEVYDDPAGAVTTDPLRLDEIDPEAFDIPVVVNADVKRWMRYFLGRGRHHFERYLGRRHIYGPMIRAHLREAGLPEDLEYLSMIESGFNAHALSHAGAAGLWQFMPATGRSYDLRVDWWVDDRRDPLKATEAAVAHLGDLHRMFDGDWLLAWSAYNAGPGRVRRAMRKAGSEDFWVLARGRHLPSETANYAPKLMAAAILTHNADRYGFEVKPRPELDVEVVRVDGAVTLEALARCAELDVDALRHLNPGLRRWATPAEGYDLNLPRGRAAAFRRALAALPRSERVEVGHHVVRRGETLSIIASRYDVTVEDLVRLNHLADADRIVVGLSLLVPRPPAAGAPAPTSSAPERPSSVTVRQGDTLSSLARAHGVSTAELRTWNRLDGDLIRVGQVLRLRPGTGAGAPAERVVTYTVSRGDTLSAVAARYGVSVSDLRAWNDLSDTTIRVGQRLEVRRPAWRTVTVAPGDSLGRIAAREGCSVQELRTWNDLSGDVIHPGQVLRLRR